MLALGVTNTLTTEPENKGKEADEVFVWLKGKRGREGRKYPREGLTSLLAQVPPSGLSGNYSHPQPLLDQMEPAGNGDDSSLG